MLLGERVVAIDRLPERLALAREKIGSETIDYSVMETLHELRLDARIEAVVMEAQGAGPMCAYDRVK